jgi:hypothetical protein
VLNALIILRHGTQKAHRVSTILLEKAPNLIDVEPPTYV